MEATTVRLIKDGTRRIVVFENVDESSDQLIADMVKNFMFPSIIEKTPYSDKPVNATAEVVNEVSELVNEAMETTKSSKSKKSNKNIEFVESTPEINTEIAAAKASFKVVVDSKPVLSLSLSIAQIIEYFNALKKGENPFSDMNYENACLSIYALISRFLTNEKNVDNANFIKLYEIFGYSGSLSECKEAAKTNMLKKKIMPIKVLSQMIKNTTDTEE